MPNVECKQLFVVASILTSPHQSFVNACPHLIRVVGEGLEQNGEYVVDVLEHLSWNLQQVKMCSIKNNRSK